VGKLSDKCQASQCIREHTQGKNPMNVMFVRKPPVIGQLSLYIREYILGRNLMNVRNVGKLSPRSQTSLIITEFTQERNPMNVMNVENPPKSKLREHQRTHIGE